MKECNNQLFPIMTQRLILKLTSIEDLDLLIKTDKQPIAQAYLGGVKNKSLDERIQYLTNLEKNIMMVV